MNLDTAIVVEGRSKCWSARIEGGLEGEEAGMSSVDYSFNKFGCIGKEIGDSSRAKSFRESPPCQTKMSGAQVAFSHLNNQQIKTSLSPNYTVLRYTACIKPRTI